MPYLYLLLSIAGELMGTLCLKYAEGFTRPWPTAGAIAAYVICFFFLSKSLRGIELSIAYASWSGIGIVAATCLSVFLFKEHLNAAGVFAIVLIVTGTELLNVSGSAH